MDRHTDLQKKNRLESDRNRNPLSQKSFNLKDQDGVFLNTETLTIFKKVSAPYLGSFIKIKYAYLNNTNKWVRTTRASIHEVLGYSNDRNVYYVLHKLKNCGVIQVRFMRHKGIFIKLVGLAESETSQNHRHINISLGETLTISAGDFKCT